MSNIKKILNIIIIALGMFALLIMLHELFHLIFVNGIASGVCFGNCYVGNIANYIAPIAIHWTTFTAGFGNVELYAWIFAFSILAILSYVYWRIK